MIEGFGSHSLSYFGTLPFSARGNMAAFLNVILLLLVSQLATSARLVKQRATLNDTSSDEVKQTESSHAFPEGSEAASELDAVDAAENLGNRRDSSGRRGCECFSGAASARCAGRSAEEAADCADLSLKAFCFDGTCNPADYCKCNLAACSIRPPCCRDYETTVQCHDRVDR